MNYLFPAGILSDADVIISWILDAINYFWQNIDITWIGGKVGTK